MFIICLDTLEYDGSHAISDNVHFGDYVSVVDLVLLESLQSPCLKFFWFVLTEALGHGGPLTISDNVHYGISDILMKGSAEMGIPANPSYNSGVNNGLSTLF